MLYFMWLFFAGIRLVIVLQVIDMVVLIVILKMVMAKIEAMIGMQEVEATDMEVEGQQEMREEITEAGQVLTIAPAGEGAHLPLTATKCCLAWLFS